MEWKAGAGEKLEAKTDKWVACIERSEEHGWTYSIQPVTGAEPHVMGNSSSADLCKTQVANMIEIMAKWN